MTTKTKLTQSELHQNTGSETIYKHWLGLKFTEGIHHLRERAECHWLIDAIASYLPTVRNDDYLNSFCYWELTISEGSATLTCAADSDMEPAITQKIPDTDFSDHCDINPLKLYQCSGVLMLPSEN